MTITARITLGLMHSLLGWRSPRAIRVIGAACVLFELGAMFVRTAEPSRAIHRTSCGSRQLRSPSTCGPRTAHERRALRRQQDSARRERVAILAHGTSDVEN